MSRAKPSSTALLDDTARFARALLKRASETKLSTQVGEQTEPAIPAHDLDTQLATLSVVTRWVAVLHRIRPEDPDDSEFDRLRGRLGVGAARGTTADGKRPAKRGAGGKVGEAKAGNGTLLSGGADHAYDTDLRRTASDEDDA